MEFEMYYKIMTVSFQIFKCYPTAGLYSSEFIHLNYFNNGEQDFFWNFVIQI